MARYLHDQAGSILPVVLLFSIIAALMVFAFVSGQYMIARPALKNPSNLQALCNARSGIWKAMEMISRNDKPDTLKKINTLDSLFNKDLFGKPGDTNSIKVEDLTANATPLKIQPYSCDSFGNCEVSLSYKGCFELLSSKGLSGASEKNVLVTLAGSIKISPDTVYYLQTGEPLQGSIVGKGRIGEWNDTSNMLRSDDLTNLVADLTKELKLATDTLVKNIPLTIQSNDQFEKIPDFVNGPLFIDGSRFDLSWKQKRRISVAGNVQITGKTTIEGADFAASGEIKCFDDSRLLNASIFSAKRISMSDRSIFSGTAISRAGMLFYGNATVKNRSILVTTGKKTDTITSGKSGKNISDSSADSTFAITFNELSNIDATVISLNDTLGIKIDKHAVIKGILWTKGYLGLAGTLYGVAFAKALVNPSNLFTENKQIKADAVLAGTASIRKNEYVNKYFFPFFMGKLSIMQWQEF
jgi:hypothetical protein